MYIFIGQDDPYWQSFLLFFENMHSTTDVSKFIQYRRSALEILKPIETHIEYLIDGFCDYCRRRGYKADHGGLTEFNIQKLKWLENFYIDSISNEDDYTPDELILIINLMTEHANYYKNKINVLEHGK